jgi:hypothetical protein
MSWTFNIFTGRLDQTDKKTIEQTIDNSTTITQIIEGQNFNIPGPFSNDSAAAAGGVGVGDFYFNSSGNMFVRQS